MRFPANLTDGYIFFRQRIYRNISGFDYTFCIENLNGWKCQIKQLRMTIAKVQTYVSFSWYRKTGTREAVLLLIRKCWRPSRSLHPHSANFATIYAKNWCGNGGVAQEASVTSRRSQWTIHCTFFFRFFLRQGVFCDLTIFPNLREIVLAHGPRPQCTLASQTTIPPLPPAKSFVSKLLVGVLQSKSFFSVLLLPLLGLFSINQSLPLSMENISATRPFVLHCNSLL